MPLGRQVKVLQLLIEIKIYISSPEKNQKNQSVHPLKTITNKHT